MNDKEFEQMALRVAKEEFTKAHRWPVTSWWDETAPIFAAIATRIRDELCKGQEPVAWFDNTGRLRGRVSREQLEQLCRDELARYCEDEGCPHNGSAHAHPAPIPADIESLREQLAAMTAERDRLHTIDLDLQMAVQKLAAVKAERDELENELIGWRTGGDEMIVKYDLGLKLAASQAREQQLREALEEVMQIESEVESIKEYNKTIRKAKAALALPSDDTALKQYVAELLLDAAEKIGYADRGILHSMAAELEAGK